MARARRWLATPQAKLDSRRKAVSNRDDVEVKQIPTARPAGGLVHQHRIGGEERRKHHDVAEQEDPEAVADNDALLGEFGELDAGADGAPADPSPPRPTAVVRAAMLIRQAPSGRAPSGARRGSRGRCARPPRPECDIRCGRARRRRRTWRRRRRTPEAASHQICQMRAKPRMAAKKAQTKPVALFLGISMS